MKYILLFLFAFCTLGALQAQNPPCQAYAAASAWSSTGYVVITAYDSSAAAVSGYLWNTGETTETITVTTSGNYCVTITYDDGCTASDCYFLSDSCYVLAWWYWVDSTVMQLVADDQPYYFGTATYLWSTGETTPSIYTSTPGNYCVTITKDYGCTASACMDVGAPPLPPCQLFFWTVPDTSGNGGVKLKSFLDVDGTPTYLWDNGATTSSIVVTEPGTYCVTATNGLDCTQSHCFEMDCAVYIQENPAGGLTANSVVGTPPYTYLWSNGATTQSMTPNATGNYWVTVTDATGCTSSDYSSYFVTCNATIDYNSDNTLTANMNGDGPFTYEWSQGGFTTQTIAPTQSGFYYVTVTNANGCSNWAFQYWYEPTNCELLLTTSQYSDSLSPNNTVWIIAQPEGSSADWELEWNTGSYGNPLVVTAAGEYCVTATNVFNGCSATACTWVQPDGACYVQIASTQLNPTTVQLSATGGPDPIVSYAWSTGDNTPTTNVTESGQYSVTVTNSAGCTVSNYYWVYAINQLNVHVSFTDSSDIGNNGVHADIYIIEFDPAQGGILTAIDTVATYSWSNSWAFVHIQDIPPGEYLIKAALKPNSNGYDNHLPTYYEDALLWSEATPVSVNSISGTYAINNIYINFIPGQNPGGPGFVGGLVTQGANFAGEGDPFPGASVILTLPNGTPVAATVTNALGEYSFGNLAWGTYTLILDIPGIDPVSVTVTIGPGQTSVTNANFKVDEDSAVLPVQDIDLEKLVKIYPNPAHESLAVELPAPADLTLLNAQGQAVLQAHENGPLARLSLQHLPQGIYFLNAQMADQTVILKVMIE